MSTTIFRLDSVVILFIPVMQFCILCVGEGSQFILLNPSDAGSQIKSLLQVIKFGTFVLSFNHSVWHHELGKMLCLVRILHFLRWWNAWLDSIQKKGKLQEIMTMSTCYTYT